MRRRAAIRAASIAISLALLARVSASAGSAPPPSAERIVVSGTITGFDDAENAYDVRTETEPPGKGSEVVRVIKTPDTKLVKPDPDGGEAAAMHSDFEVGARIRATGHGSRERLVADELRLLAKAPATPARESPAR